MLPYRNAGRKWVNYPSEQDFGCKAHSLSIQRSTQQNRVKSEEKSTGD